MELNLSYKLFLESSPEGLVNTIANLCLSAFSQELAQRYFELRADILSNESIMAEFEAFREDIPALTFVKEAIRWSEDKFYRREGLPGADYDQIEEYLNTVSERLDAKYAAWLQ